ncbi:helix-turn-helix domain-containing protein [Streptomyces canus]|uniref:helix-turn-helix domain-containing protein n=1 Tax=Streptomyces canus TaxID=58343 RepID=UPI00278497C7|nr:helix-turn-helix transcriptional regulator [Streptomyces canus]MDQ0757445.1 transcriptional regulator with XRE-family HTH domain [Streptomyces canus]
MARGVAGFDGSALRAARLVAQCPDHPHRLTVACLARRVGTSKALILSYEHGRSSPSPQRLADLARAVGVPASALQHGTQLSDLRVARGLTLAELADRLGLAVNTYRQIESSGVLPKRRPAAFWDLANELDVDHSQLHAAIRRIPAVQERREHAAFMLKDVLAHALDPGPFQAQQDTSPAATVLAAVYGVAPSTVSTMVNMLLADLRQLALQRAQLEARRDFTAHSRSTQLYERELETISNRITEDTERVPDILERYLVNPMPQSCWHSLAKLYVAGPPGSALSSGVSGDVIAALEKTFDHYLIEEDPPGFRLSAPGVLFFLDTLPYYRILYVPPDRAIRPDPQYYGWPSFRARAQPHRRHRLRVAHVLGHDPHPHWDGGSWMTIQSPRGSWGPTDPWVSSTAPWFDEAPF